MKFTHHGLQIELPDDWWTEAGMPGFCAGIQGVSRESQFVSECPRSPSRRGRASQSQCRDRDFWR